jgi:hypothetical protein
MRGEVFEDVRPPTLSAVGKNLLTPRASAACSLECSLELTEKPKRSMFSEMMAVK